MYWFTADEHYGHANVIQYNKRPYGSVEEMDKDLIKRFNSMVMKDDITIHAGDFCWLNKSLDVYNKYLKKMNGNHILLIGSHDHWMSRRYKYIWTKRIEGQLVVVCHYCMYTWPSSHYGAWQLFGHSHGSLVRKAKQYDIGVDNNNYYPVSFDQIKDIMAKKPNNPNVEKNRRRRQSWIL